MRKRKHEETDDEVIDLRDHALSAAAAYGYLRDIAYMDLAPHRIRGLILAAAASPDAALV